MSRLTYEELEKIKQKYNTDRLWSWSRMNTYMTSKFEYLLRYILKSKEDRCDSCYTTLGTICHDTLEKFYEGKIKYKDMIDDYNDGFTTAIVIADLKFNRSDEEKNKSIGEKYNENLVHFFKNHIGSFHGPEFNPYMRALYYKAELLMKLKKQEEAQKNIFLLLDLDENDHIGARCLL